MIDAVADRSTWRERAGATHRQRSEAAVLDAARRLVSKGGSRRPRWKRSPPRPGWAVPLSTSATGRKRAWPSRCSTSTCAISTPPQRATQPADRSTRRSTGTCCVSPEGGGHLELGPAPAVLSAMSRLVGPPETPATRGSATRSLAPGRDPECRPGALRGRRGPRRGGHGRRPYLVPRVRLVTHDEPAAASASFVARLAIRGLLTDPKSEVG